MAQTHRTKETRYILVESLVDLGVWQQYCELSGTDPSPKDRILLLEDTVPITADQCAALGIPYSLEDRE